MSRNLLITTPPTFQPVTLDEAKAWLGVQIDADDNMIAGLVLSAAELVRTQAKVTLCQTSYRQELDCFPYEFRLLYPPLLSVDSVKYYDTDGVLQTVDPSVYTVQVGNGGTLALAPYESWPSDLADRAGAVQVNYTSGHASADTIPATAKTAVLMLVTGWYEQRVPFSGKALREVPYGMEALINSLSLGFYA